MSFDRAYAPIARSMWRWTLTKGVSPGCQNSASRSSTLASALLMRRLPPSPVACRSVLLLTRLSPLAPYHGAVTVLRGSAAT